MDNLVAVRRKLVGQALEPLVTPQPVAQFRTAIAAEDHDLVMRCQLGLEYFIFKSSDRNGDFCHSPSSVAERPERAARLLGWVFFHSVFRAVYITSAITMCPVRFGWTGSGQKVSGS